MDTPGFCFENRQPLRNLLWVLRPPFRSQGGYPLLACLVLLLPGPRLESVVTEQSLVVVIEVDLERTAQPPSKTLDPRESTWTVPRLLRQVGQNLPGKGMHDLFGLSRCITVLEDVIGVDPVPDVRVSEKVVYTMVGGRLYDAATMNQLAPEERERGPFWWER